MKQMKLMVPTYNAVAFEREVTNGTVEEFGNPHIPVLIRQAEGLRVVLGSHDIEDLSVPDISIERRPHGWAIFLHPDPGNDPSGYVYFHDDGRSFLLRESRCLNGPRIEVADELSDVADIDAPW